MPYMEHLGTVLPTWWLFCCSTVSGPSGACQVPRWIPGILPGTLPRSCWALGNSSPTSRSWSYGLTWIYHSKNSKHCLVGGWPTPLKNDGVKVSWEYSSQYMESHKTCSKPPSNCFIFLGNTLNIWGFMGIGFDDRINKKYSMDELSLELGNL